MKRLFALAACTLAASLMSGCVAVTGLVSPGEVKRATATATGVRPEEVTRIFDQKLGLTRPSWKAQLKDGRVLECDSSTSLTDVQCAKSR